MREAVTEIVEEAGRVNDAISRVVTPVKVVFVVFGSIGVGAMIAFFPPDDLREQIPIHRELGLGFMVIGGLFGLAMFANSGPGSIGQRAKSLLAGGIFGVFAFGFGVSQWGPYGSVGYVLSFIVGLLSLSAFWEIVTGRPTVTSDP